MSTIPRLKTRADRRNVNITIDKEIDDLYRLAKNKGYDSSEIARAAVTEAFLKIKDLILKSA